MLNSPTESHSNLNQDVNNLVFVDPNVEGYDGLLSSTNSNTDVILLDSNRDGIQQISEVLANQTEIASIHLVSHGEAGKINLGNAQLSSDTWGMYRDRLADWSAALTDDADLIVYGCNVGANDDGLQLIDDLANITMADVAASDDLTGSSSLGGDWDWEVTTGAIETQLPFMADAVDGYQSVLNMSNMSGHDMVEHQAFLDLVPHDQATHVAVKNGYWFDPTTWQNGEVPGDGADVLIPKGHRVLYRGQSEARLDTLRVDGFFRFLSRFNNKMLIDTFVVSPEGKLVIGKANNPVRDNKKTEIIFTSDTPIDTELDPKQFGRGLISHGKAEIYGANKLDFVGLSGDALKNDRELVLDLPDGQTSPLGWRVGDRLVLGGTDYRSRGSNEDNTRFQDEELTITAINGNKISFTNNDITSGDNTVLRFDHKRPENLESKDLTLYVANITRNVTFETENGENVPIDHRGHVMFMHNPDVVVENAGFYNLGRSDKSKLVDDPGKNIDGSVGRGKNPRGRYALHFHRTGAEDINSTPSLARGNAVVGSPGWGIVHHDSHAVLEDNVVFDVVGSGIVAEKGNEIGVWRNNLTIKTTGDGERALDLLNKNRVQRFDFGYEGEGYWVQGAAQVEMIDNIAISASGGGINIFGTGSEKDRPRDADTFPTANLPSELQYIANGRDEIEVANLPLRRLSGFESYNSTMGMVFWQHMNNKDGVLGFDSPDGEPAHNARSLVEDFKVWNVIKDGLSLHYTTQIDFVDGLIANSLERPGNSGIASNRPAQNHLYKNLHIEGFKQGVRVPREGALYESISWLGSRLEDSYLANNITNLSDKRSKEKSNGAFIFPDYFEIANTTFEFSKANTVPTAKFTSKATGGLSRSFDASNSFDRDVVASQTLSNEEIVSYGWDFNNDGKIDKFGREVDHYFNTAGSHKVTLTVWDSHGATNSLTKTVNVSKTAYSNLIVDGQFNNPDNFNKRKGDFGVVVRFDNKGADRGWTAFGNWSWNSNLGNGGAVTLTKGWKAGLGQTIFDNGMRRGKQNLSIDLKSTDINSDPNQLKISVWGIDGEFQNRSWNLDRIDSVGAKPMKKAKLLEKTVAGSTFDWTTFNWDLNFGNGYQFIVVQVNNVGGFAANKGDFIAVDNVMIK